MNKKYIISLTTLPNRIHNIKNVLYSLCNQEYDNYEVHLNVPKITKYDGDFDISFDFKGFENDDRLKVFYVEDIGAITKIYYTLKRSEDPEQRIISVDDDFIYSSEMISIYDEMLENYFDEGVLGFAGIWPVEIETDGTLNCVGCINPDEYLKVGLLEGYKSICYKRKYFDYEFFEHWYKIDYNDDLTISSWLGYKNIDKILIPYKNEKECYNKLLSFPLTEMLFNPISGVSHLREPEGGSSVTYKKFYNSIYGQYLKR